MIWTYSKLISKKTIKIISVVLPLLLSKNNIANRYFQNFLDVAHFKEWELEILINQAIKIN